MAVLLQEIRNVTQELMYASRVIMRRLMQAFLLTCVQHLQTAGVIFVVLMLYVYVAFCGVQELFQYGFRRWYNVTRDVVWNIVDNGMVDTPGFIIVHMTFCMMMLGLLWLCSHPQSLALFISNPDDIELVSGLLNPFVQTVYHGPHKFMIHLIVAKAIFVGVLVTFTVFLAIYYESWSTRCCTVIKMGIHRYRFYSLQKTLERKMRQRDQRLFLTRKCREDVLCKHLPAELMCLVSQYSFV